MSIGDFIVSAIEKGQPFIEQWGLLAVGFSILCETLFFAGVLLPGFSIVAAAGFLAARGNINGWAAVGVAMLGGLIGAQLAYMIGRLTGDRFLRRRTKLVLRLRDAIRREGTAVILWYHHVSPMRAVLPYLAGSMGYPWERWLTFDAIGLALWVGFAFGLGYIAHGPMEQMGQAGYYAVMGLVLLMFIFTIWRVTQIFCSKSELEASDATV
jgi:membrane protein DedA with SNARE-associated domain